MLSQCGPGRNLNTEAPRQATAGLVLAIRAHACSGRNVASPIPVHQQQGSVRVSAVDLGERIVAEYRRVHDMVTGIVCSQRY